MTVLGGAAFLTLASSIGSEGPEERHTGLPACQGVSHLGPLPRQRYPLVALLTLAEPDGGSHIVSAGFLEVRKVREGEGEEVMTPSPLAGCESEHHPRS